MNTITKVPKSYNVFLQNSIKQVNNSQNSRNQPFLSNQYIQFFVQFSSEHRIKKSKQQTKVGFESKPDINQIDRDYIGPPDKLSNLRPVLRHKPADETPIEKELRLKRIEVEQWNQHFWANHNQKFFNEKQAFIKANKATEDDTLSADKMSEFYKAFLDSNWNLHFNYNREW